MTLHYQPAARLADAFLHDRVVSRIWDRDISVWGAAPGSADASSIETRLGWLDVAKTMAPHLDRVAALGDRPSSEEGIRAVYLLGMGGSSLCAEVLRARLRRRDGLPGALRARHDRRAHDHGRGGAAGAAAHARSSSPARAAARSKSRRWSGSSGRGCRSALGADAGRQFVAITDPGHRARRSSPRRAAIARCSSTRPTSAGASRRCRSSGSCRRRSSARRSRELASGGAGDGRRLPAGEPRQPRPRARRVHRRQRVRRDATS